MHTTFSSAVKRMPVQLIIRDILVLHHANHLHYEYHFQFCDFGEGNVDHFERRRDPFVRSLQQYHMHYICGMARS